MSNLFVVAALMACLVHCGEGFNWAKADELKGNRGGQGNQGQNDDVDMEDANWDQGQSGVVDTCGLQKDVISFSVEHVFDARCFQNWGYKVCLTLHLKNHPTVEKTCIKDPNVVHPPDFSTYDKLYYFNSSVGMAMGNDYWQAAGLTGPDAPTVNGNTQCQRGCSNDILMFSIKDGYRCAPTAVSGIPDFAEITGVTVAQLPGINDPVAIQCRSRLAWNNNTKNPADKIGSCICAVEKEECVWKVALPVGPFEFTPNPTSPHCHCPEESGACLKEAQLAADQGKTNQVDILDCKNPAFLADQLKEYGCRASPDCPNVICDKFVPPEVVAELPTCPIASPSPQVLIE